MSKDLFAKYDVAAPRYTSYPTVPYWSGAAFPPSDWLQHVQNAFSADRQISLYIHLPFCESLCTYCGCNKHITRNHAVEHPYIETVLREWRMYLAALSGKPVLRELHLGGDPQLVRQGLQGRRFGAAADQRGPDIGEMTGDLLDDPQPARPVLDGQQRAHAQDVDGPLAG